MPFNRGRGMVLCLIVVLAVSSLFEGYAVFGANPAVGDNDWAMFHHDLQHSGSSPTTAPNTGNVAWTYKTGDSVPSSPAVAGGRVYVGSKDLRLYCLDATTGAYIWSFLTVGEIYSGPTVVDGKVYFSSDGIYVYCLDAATGAYIWKYETRNYVGSSPAVYDGRVYVGSYDGRVYAFGPSPPTSFIFIFILAAVAIIVAITVLVVYKKILRPRKPKTENQSHF